MGKNLDIIMLFDFYRGLLTEKQAEAIDLYYNEDLSLAEISEILNVTRQGVRDNIKRAEGIMLDAEEKLGVVARYKNERRVIKAARHIISELSEDGLDDDACVLIKELDKLLCGIEE